MEDEEEGALLSQNALASIAAALAGAGDGGPERSEREKEYDAIVASVVFKDGHEQKPARAIFSGSGFTRLYTVTTIAASERFGGTRTVVVCRTFGRAKEIVEENVGDIFERTYRLVVIEAVAADRLYDFLDEDYWYAWEGDYETGRYRPIDKPEAYRNIFGFGIG